MPLQRRAAQGFAGAAVEIDLIHKGIMTTGMMMFFCEVDLRACLETHLSIMKRFNSMLAMAI